MNSTLCREKIFLAVLLFSFSLMAFLPVVTNAAQISFDSTKQVNAPIVANTNVPVTITEENEMLLCFTADDIITNVDTAVLNGVSMINFASVVDKSGFFKLWGFYLLNPTIGTHNVSFTRTVGGASKEWWASCALYKNVAQAVPEGIDTLGDFPGTIHTASVITLSQDAWTVMYALADSGGMSAGANSTLRGSILNTASALFDSNGGVFPPGPYTMTFGSNNGLGTAIIVALAPVQETEKTPQELIGELESIIADDISTKSIKNSYQAHTKKLLTFYEKNQVEAGLNQLNALLGKVNNDLAKGNLSQTMAAALIDAISKLKDAFEELNQAKDQVPLMTQISSPFPPASATWADDIYAQGSASDSCGNTIAECGCVLTSMSMLSQSYGVQKDIDGNEVQPGNMNTWLEENEGYTPDGSALWNKVLAYLGKKEGNKITTNFSLAGHNVTDVAQIDFSLALGKPALAFNAPKGHFFLLTGKNGDNSYDVRDPYWYLTKTTNDTKDTINHVQAYNDVISKANLFTFSPKPHIVSKTIEIHLGSPAELLLTDGQGRRTGFDTETGEVLFEIPGSSYDQSSVIATTGELANPHIEKVLLVQEAEDEVYTLEVIGTGEGPYTLTTLTSDDEGTFEVSHTNAQTNNDQIDAYILDVSITDGGVQSILDQLYNAIESLPVSEKKRIENLLSVLEDKIEKENLVASEHLIANIITIISHKEITDINTIVALLEELLAEL